ncbi:MAG: hypothetical protein MUF42_11520 [Cytophagaceae bacterium]|jgi:hypothetical protein|nr:hypothetical protein [Cytophagaceae bacterium]
MKEEHELYSLLYRDEEGELVGLEEVQLLDPIPVNRIPLLLNYISKEDEYVSYQIALVLTSWGQNQGLDWIMEKMLNFDSKNSIDIDRFGEADLFYEKAIESIYFYTLSGGDRVAAINSIEKALDVFFEFYVNGRFRNALFKLKPFELKFKILNLFQFSLDKNKLDRIAALLPVVAILDELLVLNFIRSNKKQILSSFDLIDASTDVLFVIHTEDSKLILHSLLSEISEQYLKDKGEDFLQNW